MPRGVEAMHEIYPVAELAVWAVTAEGRAVTAEGRAATAELLLGIGLATTTHFHVELHRRRRLAPPEPTRVWNETYARSAEEVVDWYAEYAPARGAPTITSR